METQGTADPKVKSKDESKDRSNFVGFGALVLILLIFGGWWFWVANCGSPGQFSWPDLGDAFSTLNTLFSGLAFAVLVWTLLLQHKELQDTRKAQDELSQLQAFTALMQSYPASRKEHIEARERVIRLVTRGDYNFLDRVGRVRILPAIEFQPGRHEAPPIEQLAEHIEGIQTPRDDLKFRIWASADPTEPNLENLIQQRAVRIQTALVRAGISQERLLLDHRPTNRAKNEAGYETIEHNRVVLIRPIYDVS